MKDLEWTEATSALERIHKALEEMAETVNRLHKERESWKDCATRTQDALDDAEERIHRLEVERDEAIAARDSADENYASLEDSEEAKRGELEERIRYLEECVRVRDDKIRESASLAWSTPTWAPTAHQWEKEISEIVNVTHPLNKEQS